MTSPGVDSLQVAEDLRRTLHLQRISASPEGQAFAAAVAEAIALPLQALQKHVGPYPLFRPGQKMSLKMLLMR